MKAATQHPSKPLLLSEEIEARLRIFDISLNASEIPVQDECHEPAQANRVNVKTDDAEAEAEMSYGIGDREISGERDGQCLIVRNV